MIVLLTNKLETFFDTHCSTVITKHCGNNTDKVALNETLNRPQVGRKARKLCYR